jgi:hypothetical protein
MPPKRVKVRCLVCQPYAEFDSDYRIKHNQKFHQHLIDQRKAIPYENADAVLNHFAQVRESTRMQAVQTSTYITSS